MLILPSITVGKVFAVGSQKLVLVWRIGSLKNAAGLCREVTSISPRRGWRERKGALEGGLPYELDEGLLYVCGYMDGSYLL